MSSRTCRALHSPLGDVGIRDLVSKIKQEILNLVQDDKGKVWIPACAGMTKKLENWTWMTGDPLGIRGQ